MIFLKGRKTAKAWFVEQKAKREICIIDETIEFASRYFKSLIHHG